MTASPTGSESPDPQRLVVELAELAGGLAHELRNPLSTMMVNLKLLAEDLNDLRAHPEDTRRRGLLKVDVLLREAERLQRLFDKFLSVAGPYQLEWTEVDVNEIVERLLAFFEPSAAEQTIVVKKSLRVEPISCRVDATLLRQALLNLLINAQQAMPDGGEIGVSTVVSGDEVLITVSDTGMGIADEDRQRILRPFFSTKAGGGGLGLSITQRIVQEHGGSIGYESRRGEGTSFTIRLPVVSGEPPR